MEELLTIMIIAVVYAMIRAKRDSLIVNGPWKLWAFIMGVLITAGVSVACWQIFHTTIWELCWMPVIFGTVFSIIFDGVSGLLRARKWFYFGSGKFDQWLDGVFKGKPAGFFIVKMFWLVISLGAYTGFMILI